MQSKKITGIDDKLIDEIVDEIVSTITEREKIPYEDVIEKRNLSEIVKLKERISALENRVEKYINSFKLVAIETERLISERIENLTEENLGQIAHLQTQIEDLRHAMIRLSNEVKKIAEKLKY
jgi:hypothetical protein